MSGVMWGVTSKGKVICSHSSSTRLLHAGAKIGAQMPIAATCGRTRQPWPWHVPHAIEYCDDGPLRELLYRRATTGQQLTRAPQATEEDDLLDAGKIGPPPRCSRGPSRHNHEPDSAARVAKIVLNSFLKPRGGTAVVYLHNAL